MTMRADRRRRGDHRGHWHHRSRRSLHCWGCRRRPRIDVLSDANARSYWQRSDQFDMALDMTAGRRSLNALGEVIAAWIFHMLSIEVDIEPLTEIRDVNLSWYVGLER